METIAIFGCGFVGGTVANFLEKTGTTVIRVDPLLHPTQDPQQAVLDADGIIICVPTPSNPDGTCNDSIVLEILELTDYRHKILIKSSITFDCLRDYEPNVVYNPEFLREATATEDFENQEHWIFGHHTNNKDGAEWWCDLFSTAMGYNVPVSYTTLEEASMIKYVHNAWLATKVAFFHELSTTLPHNVDYDTITSVLGKFRRIGPDMMKSPNNNGTLGYSGACFPKDVKALTKVIDHSIINTVNETNDKLNKLN
jgi:UDPglucose 6-dehydrogenase